MKKTMSLAKMNAGIENILDYWRAEFGYSITRGNLPAEVRDMVCNELLIDSWATTNERNRKENFVCTVFEEKMRSLPIWMAKERLVLQNCLGNIKKIIASYRVS